MADKNIEMQILNGSGTYDALYPKTLGQNTIISDSVASEMGLSSGATVDQALSTLQSKKMYGDIGSLIITASQPSKEYLNTENYETVNISDYPQLYNIFYDNPFMTGYRQICVLPSTSINKFGYNNGLYWCATNTTLYYTTSLTQEWSIVQSPDSSLNIKYIDCINNIWFICGEKYSSYFDSTLTYIAYSNNISSWSMVPTTNITDGKTVQSGMENMYYLNDSYIVKVINGTNVRFYQFTSLSSIYSDVVSFNYTSTPSVNISAANGIWYFSFDTSSGSIYHQIKNGTSTFSNTSIIISCSNTCGNIKTGYKNGTYYIRTGDGIYASSSSNSNFSLISTNTNGIEYQLQTNGYWYYYRLYPSSSSSIKVGMGFNITKDFENIYYSCVTPIYQSGVIPDSLYYDIYNNTMYAAIDGVLYINDNTQFMVPYYKKGDDICKTYIKAL